jgi:hypothetical protein
VLAFDLVGCWLISGALTWACLCIRLGGNCVCCHVRRTGVRPDATSCDVSGQCLAKQLIYKKLSLPRPLLKATIVILCPALKTAGTITPGESSELALRAQRSNFQALKRKDCLVVITRPHSEPDFIVIYISWFSDLCSRLSRSFGS